MTRFVRICIFTLALCGAGCGASHPEALLARAKAAEGKGNLVEAQRLYQQVLARDPHHAEALEAHGLVLLRLNRRAEAAEELQRAIALFPASVRSAAPLARLYLDERRIQDASAVLSPWQGQANPPAAIALLLAELKWQTQDRAAAMSILQDLADGRGPEATAARLKLAALLLSEGGANPARLDEADHHLREVLASDPSSIEAQIGLAAVLLARNKPEQARDQFARAWVLAEKPPLAAIGLIVSSIRQRELGRATDVAGELCAAYPGELNYSILRAEIAAAAERREALEAIELPESAGSLKQYVDGLRHISNGEYFDAYPLLTSVAKEWKDYGPAQLFAGLAAERLNDRTQALLFFKGARANLPADVELGALVVRTALAQSQTDFASEELGKLAGESAGLEPIRVEAEFRRAKYAEALKEAEKWGGPGGNPAALAAQGDILEALGKKEQALAMWRKAADSGDGEARAWAALRIAWAQQDWAGAHAAIDKLGEHWDKASIEILRGRLEMARGGVSEARAHFDLALLEDPRNAAAHAWLGLWQLLQREIVSAHQNFERSIELNPDEPIALWGEGFMALMNRSHDRSEKLLRQSLAASPGFDLARLTLAQTLLTQGRAGESLEVLGGMGAGARDLLPVADLRGRALILEKRWKEADELWTEFGRKQPASPVPYFYRAQIQFIRGDRKAARQTVEAGLKVSPTDARLQLARADLLWDSGKIDEALLLTTKLAKTDKSLEAALLQAAMHLERSHHSKASTVLKELVAAQPDDPRVYSMLADAQLILGKPEEALLTLRTGWLRLPNEVLLGLRLADLHEKAKNHAEATAVYREILKIQPDNVRALNQLAWRLAENHSDLDEALELAGRALQLKPGHMPAQDTQAWIYYQQEKFSQARKALDDLIKTAPNDPYVRYHRGLALWKTGEKDGARAVLEKLLAEQPSFAEAETIKEVLKKI